MRRTACVALLLALSNFTSTAWAADKPDPTGTWKWSFTANNQTRETTLKLKLEADKLTGHIVGRNKQETAIEDATFKDSVVAFSVTRERNGQKIITKYKGKLDGDTIKGKSEVERDGKTQERDWEAKREKAEKK
ncbi:MAG: hypothetical protein V4719_17935 [Planctomycetota bacterium]